LPTKDQFRAELHRQFELATKRGVPTVDINSGDLHLILGDYPGTGHRMPTCCDAMYAEQREGDRILQQAEKGKGASLTIRYKLPRPNYVPRG
jgi:hypothetical protein